jgi:D-beta-D-heptose 7-phosphate kinase/D-beta-D-heptose 1-phosphate adenosyltransferase
MHQGTVARTSELLVAAEQVHVVVVGDVMLDHYYWGTVSRVSPEAPVPVVDLVRESFHLGGAANVAANIRALGASAALIGAVGDDPAGVQLRSLAEEGQIDASGIHTAEDRPTTMKTRIIGNNQQLIRLDRESRAEVSESVVERIMDDVRSRPSINAIVLQDYDKGLLSADLMRRIIDVAQSRSIPVFVDPKKTQADLYHGAFVFKPNRKEAADMLGYALTSPDLILRAGQDLLDRIDCAYVLLTLGSKGMMLFHRTGEVRSVPTVAKKVADVSGAGDTVIATLATLVAAGADVAEAAGIANIAAGVVVGEPGIVSITAPVLLEAVREDGHYIGSLL